MRRYAPIAPSKGTVIPSDIPARLCPVCNERPIARHSKTCGPRCGYELRKSSVKARPCVGCGTPFRPFASAIGRGAKYCSWPCYTKLVAKRPAMLPLTCRSCGTEFRRTRAAVQRSKTGWTFCSVECSTSYRRGEHHTSWRGGSDPNRGQGWRRIAEEVRERDGFLCRRCGKSQADNGQRLSVDHIIPWRSFTNEEEANDPANLASLCRPCHSRKARAERLWIKGDVLEMWSYQIAVAEPWRATA